MEEDQEYPEEDLEIVREWFEEIRVDRIDEANRLEVELAQAERDIREFLEELENVDAWKSERGHIEWMWKLERNQRERQERERNTYKPTTTSHKRAAEWKERKSKG